MQALDGNTTRPKVAAIGPARLGPDPQTDATSAKIVGAAGRLALLKAHATATHMPDFEVDPRPNEMAHATANRGAPRGH